MQRRDERLEVVLVFVLVSRVRRATHLRGTSSL
jgi:hypothetical protein